MSIKSALVLKLSPESKVNLIICNTDSALPLTSEITAVNWLAGFSAIQKALLA
jgi:hypothetical protein